MNQRTHGRFVFRLYVTGDSPRSRRAVENLRALCKRHIADRHEIEVVDVLEEPIRALEDGVVVTPSLMKLARAPPQTIVGDLSDGTDFLCFLGLPDPTPEP